VNTAGPVRGKRAATSALAAFEFDCSVSIETATDSKEGGIRCIEPGTADFREPALANIMFPHPPVAGVYDCGSWNEV